MTEMNEEIHVKLDNGKKIRHKRSHAECIVADVIPHAMEVEIGTRVLAKWYNRLDTFYPGTVVAVRRSLFDIRFDDGDKGCNELRELRILGPKTEADEGTMYIRLVLHSYFLISSIFPIPLYMAQDKSQKNVST